MSTYTVVGVYSEPLGQRFATTVEADDPRAAELAARKEADTDLLVAAVIAGDHESLDTYTDGLSNVPGELTRYRRTVVYEIEASSDDEADEIWDGSGPEIEHGAPIEQVDVGPLDKVE